LICTDDLRAKRQNVINIASQTSPLSTTAYTTEESFPRKSNLCFLSKIFSRYPYQGTPNTSSCLKLERPRRKLAAKRRKKMFFSSSFYLDEKQKAKSELRRYFSWKERNETLKDKC